MDPINNYKFDVPPFSMPNTSSDPEGRVEGVFKVTGKGKYAAEYSVEGMCYGVMVGSSIASGKLIKVFTEEALMVKGVIDVLHVGNKPTVPAWKDAEKALDARLGLPVLHTDKIFFHQQPIALVVAETLEDAQYAASLVYATYEKSEFEVDFFSKYPSIPLKENAQERGSRANWAQAPYQVEQEYTIQGEVHHPMEPHATIAHWTAQKLTLYDKNQGVNMVQNTLGRLFNIPPKQIEVTSPFVGGGFGSGLRVWPHTPSAVMASIHTKRPVKVVLTRQQMFTGVGYRPPSWQRVKLAANENGVFQGLVHESKHGTSQYEQFNENITKISRLIYAIPNVYTASALVPLHLSTPTWMRGPGDGSGAFALESAIDELSYRLKMDPVEIRLKNISSEVNPDNKLPWSTHFLKECLEMGAEKIGWKNRNPLPGSTTEGDWRIGYGVGVGMWNAGRSTASAALEWHTDGTITILTAMTDIGTGTGTAIQEIAHLELGLPKGLIKVELGSSLFPPAPSQGGSTGLSTISGAIVEVCRAFQTKLKERAQEKNSAFDQVEPKDIRIDQNSVWIHANPQQKVPLAQLRGASGSDLVQVEAKSGPGAERNKFAFCSSAAHFCLVRVHKITGKIKVDRMVSVADGGKIVNAMAAANQISGAAIGGIGMALLEEFKLDHRSGAIVAADFAGYHFAVQADAPLIDVSFIGKPDPNINPTGAKGLGEVGIIGCAAALSNAVYHATGRRMRNLPMTPENWWKSA